MNEFKDQGEAYEPTPHETLAQATAAAAALFGNGGSMGPNAMASATSGANELVESAKNGGFTVTKDIANELITTLRHFVDRIDDMKNSLRIFDQKPPLGDHDYGRLVADYMHRAANGPGSARFAVEQLRVVLETSIEALLHASDQYDEAEANAKDALGNADPSA